MIKKTKARPRQPARARQCGMGGSRIQGKPDQSAQLAGLRCDRAPAPAGRFVLPSARRSVSAARRQAAMMRIRHDPQSGEWESCIWTLQSPNRPIPCRRRWPRLRWPFFALSPGLRTGIAGAERYPREWIHGIADRSFSDHLLV